MSWQGPGAIEKAIKGAITSEMVEDAMKAAAKGLFGPYIPPEWPYWMKGYKAALHQAKQTDKIVFALFTGYPWCNPCVALDKEVLTTDYFAAWSKRVVLLMVLCPPFIEDENKYIKDLKSKYEVYGVPTAIGLNSDGSERGRILGYESGTGPKPWLLDFEIAAKMDQCPLP